MRQVKAALLAIVLLAMGVFSQPARGEVSFGVFYSDLNPHGSWLVSSQYGRVWQPGIYRPGWNPYYDGHWAYTDLGWTWVSDYEWGATPYHYGTWVEEPEMGWVWVPGYVWGPSWVVFSSGSDYIGWAPVPPNYSMSLSLSVSDISPSHFVFVSSGNFLAPQVRSYAVPQSRTSVIINRTKIVNNITVQNNVVVNQGPDVTIVERASGRKIRAVPIEQVARVAHGPHFTREEIRVDSRKTKADPRVAEPVSAKTSLPATPRGGTHSEKMKMTTAETTSRRGGSSKSSVDEPVAPAPVRATTPSDHRGVTPTPGRRTPNPRAETPHQEEAANGPAAASQGHPHSTAQPAGPPAKPSGKKKAPKKDPQAPKKDNSQDPGDHRR
jgi:hypothetical protein